MPRGLVGLPLPFLRSGHLDRPACPESRFLRVAFKFHRGLLDCLVFNSDLVGSPLGAFFHEAQGVILVDVDSSSATLAFCNRRQIHDSDLAGIARPGVTPHRFACPVAAYHPLRLTLAASMQSSG